MIKYLKIRQNVHGSLKPMEYEYVCENFRIAKGCVEDLRRMEDQEHLKAREENKIRVEEVACKSKDL